MNDFYAPRRTIIADVAGLIGMAVAGVASSALVWETLATGFKTGRLERAFLVFLSVVLGASALGGLVGLWGGRALGGAWEQRHRHRRPSSGEADESEAPTPPGEAHSVTAPAVTGLAGGLTLRSFGAEVADFMALAQRVEGPGATTRQADVLRHSTNIGAWDGARLVGAVRMVSDGRVALVADLLVDPAYRRRGVGRGLMRAAQAQAGRAPLHVVGANAGAASFLEASGAVRSADAWTVVPR